MIVRGRDPPRVHYMINVLLNQGTSDDEADERGKGDIEASGDGRGTSKGA